MQYPKVSFLLPTFNSAQRIEDCLTSIRNLNYPQTMIQILVVDGGSKDDTLKITQRYNCTVLRKPGVLSEAAKAYGLKIAKGEYIIDFADDNRLPDKKWLVRMITPLLKDSSLAGSYPLRYSYQKNDTAFNRYLSLVGVNDIVPFYLKKADRLSYLHDEYNLKGLATDHKTYYEVEFFPDDIPTLGANGFVIRKKILQKACISPNEYFHIDVVYDLVLLGYSKFAVVKTDIIHATGSSMVKLLKKRTRYIEKLYLEQKSARRYEMVTKNDYSALLLFIIYSLTFIQPLIISVRGFYKIPDWAWLYHPPFCFFTVIVYGFIYLKQWTKKLLFQS